MNFAELQERALQEGAVYALDDSAPAPTKSTQLQNAPTPAPDECPPGDSEGAIEWMNARYFVAFDAGRAAVMAEELDPVESRVVLKSYSFQDIRQFYMNRYVDTRVEGDRPKREPLGK